MFVDCILCYGGWFLIHCHCSEFIEWIKLNQEWGWVVIERVWVSEWMSEVKTHFPPNKCLDRIDLRLYASFHIQIILIHFLAIMLLACAIWSERLVVSAGFPLLLFVASVERLNIVMVRWWYRQQTLRTWWVCGRNSIVSIEEHQVYRYELCSASYVKKV